MSSVTTSNRTSNQVTNAYDFSKIFIFDNKFRKVTIANASGSDLALTAGMAIGVVGTTYQVYKSGTSNISFVGICAEDITISDGDSADVNICIGGKVNENKVTLDGTDTLATVVSNRTIRDRIASESVDIYLVATDELSSDDNV